MSFVGEVLYINVLYVYVDILTVSVMVAKVSLLVFMSTSKEIVSQLPSCHQFELWCCFV